jgi:hypothetical protein
MPARRKGAKHQVVELDTGYVPKVNTQASGLPSTVIVLVHPIAGHAENYEGQVVQRMRRANPSGELLEFATMLQVRAEGADGWNDVVRVDCSHGFVHIDRYRPDGTSMKDEASVPTECRDDLDAALKWANDFVWDLEERFGEWQR